MESIGTLAYAKRKYLSPTGNKYGLTMKKVNAEIAKHFPNVFLVKDNGYFYLASDDHETGLNLAGLYQTSIHVSRLNSQPLERWINDVRNLMEEKNKF